MFCSKCGEKLEETVVFCPKCGTNVVSNVSGIGQSNDQVSNYPVQSATDMSKLIMIVAGIILSVIGIVLIKHGSDLNNSISAQISSYFSKGSTNPGTFYIVFGILGLVAGVILLIIGLLKKPNNLGITGDQSSNGFAIAGLVLGILSVLGLGIPLGFVGIPLSITGRRKLKLCGRSTAMATVGLVLNIVGLAIMLIYLIIIIVLVIQ
ncbi:MAG: zinc-ribbon domain-containing protein [Treponema sp.]|jgi:hypothetical protein|nr:zinc-ribbon domain-containing protein [Treponema sp.]